MKDLKENKIIKIMENPTGEIRMAEQEPIADILDGNYIVHYAEIKILRKVLKRGLYSGRFAARMGDEDYEQFMEKERDIWLNAKIGNNYSRFSNKDVVGILVKGRPRSEIERVPLRIAPRKFAAIVILDDYNHPQTRVDFAEPKKLRQHVDQRLREIKAILTELNIHLPIFGSTGDLYWPVRMSHDQIVRRNLEQMPSASEVKRSAGNLLQAFFRAIKRLP